MWCVECLLDGFPQPTAATFHPSKRQGVISKGWALLPTHLGGGDGPSQRGPGPHQELSHRLHTSWCEVGVYALTGSTAPAYCKACLSQGWVEGVPPRGGEKVACDG